MPTDTQEFDSYEKLVARLEGLRKNWAFWADVIKKIFGTEHPVAMTFRVCVKTLYDAIRNGKKGRTFLICPVRGYDQSKTLSIVLSLEAEGWSVHYPARDTNQDDAIGYQICRDNLAAIRASDYVHVIWDGQSQGCLFDLGIAFALNKKIIIIELPSPSNHKSFQNMVRAWSNDN